MKELCFSRVTSAGPVVTSLASVQTDRTTIKLPILTALLLLTPLMSTPAAPSSLTPDLLILNAQCAWADRAQTEAVAIASHTLRRQAHRRYARSGPKDALLTPVNAPCYRGSTRIMHWLSGGYSITNVDLRGATSPAELARRLEARRQFPPGADSRRLGTQVPGAIAH